MRRIQGLFLLFLTVILLTGCGGDERPCADLLGDFCAQYGDLPSGQSYFAGAEEWEAGAMPPDMADILFTEDNGENAFSLCTDYAIFLSSSYGGGEIAFLRAEGRGDAARLAEMCASRLARVTRALPDGEIGQGACVVQKGYTVVLLLLPDNGRAKEICRDLL